ncbi:MAG: NAD(P)H-binding protein [Alphaproteobacteria bacterium]|nr:NAD(P)H-binding protein [Alphaproteobacteria bacterium]
MKIAITGANSAVGQTLLGHIARDGELVGIAGVRSKTAADGLPAAPNIVPRVISYDDPARLAEALAGARCVVHLAGILIEARGTSYESANVEASRAVVEAARRIGAEHVVFVSVLGADPRSSNRYLKSKGEAERIVGEAGPSSTVIRTPILLGPGTAGANALLRAVSKGKASLLGGGRYVMRPLDVDDLCAAILTAARARPQGHHTHELGGPEPIAYRDLVQRFARAMGKEVAMGAVPVWIAKLAAGIASRLSGGGMTPQVIDIITGHEEIAENADAALGVRLTPLDETLRKIIRSA